MVPRRAPVQAQRALLLGAAEEGEADEGAGGVGRGRAGRHDRGVVGEREEEPRGEERGGEGGGDGAGTAATAPPEAQVAAARRGRRRRHGAAGCRICSHGVEAIPTGVVGTLRLKVAFLLP